MVAKLEVQLQQRLGVTEYKTSARIACLRAEICNRRPPRSEKRLLITQTLAFCFNVLIRICYLLSVLNNVTHTWALGLSSICNELKRPYKETWIV
jgi:hypothetical protein